LVKQGHQVMVFVHARKDTVNAAFSLKDAATAEGTLPDYSCEDHPQWRLYRRDIGESRNKEMKQLFDHGFGIHHAGMLRSDRNLAETLFRARVIKVPHFWAMRDLMWHIMSGTMLHCNPRLGSQLARSRWSVTK